MFCIRFPLLIKGKGSLRLCEAVDAAVLLKLLVKFCASRKEDLEFVNPWTSQLSTLSTVCG